jgi:hypothetical protein
VSAGVTRRGSKVRFVVSLTPKGHRDAIEGWMEGADGAAQLKARVAASPEDGKANAALIALLANSLAVPKAAIEIVAGKSARLKIVDVTGNAAALTASLEALGKMK